MDLASLYWGSWDYPSDPDYTRQVETAFNESRERVLRYQEGALLEPTIPNLLRLVDVEFGRPDDSTHRIRRRRWQAKVDTLKAILRPGQTVVDCGSGFGTEAIAFALLGARVTAVDLFPVFLRILEMRVGLYGEVFGKDLLAAVDRVPAHLPFYCPPQKFDFAWSNESIEHIAPLDRFLERLPSWLNPGGAAVLCNDNALNLVRLAQVMRARRSFGPVYLTKKNPLGSDTVTYALEVIMSPLRLRSLLLSAGFASVDLTMMSVVPSMMATGPRYEKLADLGEHLARVPGVRFLAAGDYVAIAQRA